MSMKWISGVVIEKKVWTESLFTLRIDVEGVEPFIPGQFLQLGMQLDDKFVHRPYSVASPYGPVLDFYIVLVEDGKLTPHLWKMDSGSFVEVSQHAAGTFTLQKAPHKKNLWLFGTGTGLAPYIAMLRTPEPWDIYEQIVLVHCCRYEIDLSYQEEIQSYLEQYPERFSYVPTLTREEAAGVSYGRIPSLVETGKIFEKTSFSLTAEESAVLLCGNPAMLDDMEALLQARGLKKHKRREPGNYVLERYW